MTYQQCLINRPYSAIISIAAPGKEKVHAGQPKKINF